VITDLIRLSASLNQPLETVREMWSERAAIREYDGGYPRAEAERLATEDVLRLLEKQPSLAGVA
jgi:hypothetical protein